MISYLLFIMEKAETILKFDLPQNISISVPKRYVEGFRERIINLIYESPDEVIENFKSKKENSPNDVMKNEYLSK